jgi:hypothetical protein
VIKSYALHDIPMNHVAAMERWYHRDHAPEILRRYGPWMTRFECYLPVPAPVDAQAYGLYNWRMTEIWWRELPEAQDESDLFFSPAKTSARVAACFVPPQPTETFVAADSLPLDKAPLRWLILFHYPERVSREQGEEWFVDVHAPELAKLPSLYRFFSYRVVQEVTKVPGRWREDTLPPAGHVRASWDRVIELWYETFDDWAESMAASTHLLTRPDWATRAEYPWVEPFVDFASAFLLERPNDDFLRDLRAYVP